MPKIKMLTDICVRYNIALVYLFGSRSREAFLHLQGHEISIDDPLADIDVGIVLGTELPPAGERYRLYADISNEFTDLFEPFTVDLSLLEENHSIFQLEAIKGRCAYYADIGKKENYEEMILRRAADFRPVLDLFLKEALEEI
jgi:predicted nucleotidyltransferase